MAVTFGIQAPGVLLGRVHVELQPNGSVYGTPGSLFHRCRQHDRFAARLFGHYLATPIGSDVGSHTPLTENILVGWLCTARLVDPKTVSTLDTLGYALTCVDVAYEGCNAEWSQMSEREQSAWSYVTAWAESQVLQVDWTMCLNRAHPLGWTSVSPVGYNGSAPASLDGTSHRSSVYAISPTA